MSGIRTLILAASVTALIALPINPAHAQEDGMGTNYETRLGALEEQMRAMNGQLEQLQFSVRRMETAMQRMQTDTDNRLVRLEGAAMAQPVPQPQAAYQPPAQQQQPALMVPPSSSNIAASGNDGSPPASVKGTLGSLTLQDGHVVGATSNPHAPALPQTPPDYGLTTQEQYDRAFELLRQANYDDAGDAFEGFINKNPKDKLVDNAKYWYGETLYVRGKYDTAAVAFADAYQANPKGTKAPDSLLKLALSLEALGKNPDACSTLQSLKGKYPNASPKITERADREIGKLKCGG